MFALLHTVDYNSFDGNKVVDDLLRWRHLWEAVTADWCSYSTGNRFEAVCDLHRLIYLPENLWMVDTVHILTSGIDDPLLQRQIKEHWKGAALTVFSVEQIDWNLNTGMLLPDDQHIYRVWWD